MVRLADGRRLQVTELGPRAGRPVMYLPVGIGAPLSDEFGTTLDELGLRLLLPQRPGFGASDPLPGRTLRSFARDLDELADALRLDRFAVVGVSAGGPYALAAAHELPERVMVTAAVSSLGVVDGLPRRFRLPLRLVAAAPAPCALLGDALVRRPWLLHALIRRESLRQAQAAVRIGAAGGVRGLIDDHLVTARPWGF